jgi:hypothetical protein
LSFSCFATPGFLLPALAFSTLSKSMRARRETYGLTQTCGLTRHGPPRYCKTRKIVVPLGMLHRARQLRGLGPEGLQNPIPPFGRPRMRTRHLHRCLCEAVTLNTCVVFVGLCSVLQGPSQVGAAHRAGRRG